MTIKWRVIQSQNNSEAGAIQSRRTYYCDAIYTVALCENESDQINWRSFDLSSIQDLVSKLRWPQFVLYLGRKSCPLGLPLEPQVKPGKNCIEAFQQADFNYANELQPIMGHSATIQYFSEEEFENSQMKFTRRDQPVNRSTWQFTERDEYYCSE